VPRAYVHDFPNGTTTLASVDSQGAPAYAGDRPTMSGDGRHVAFGNVLVRDLESGTTDVPVADPKARAPVISSDASTIAFISGSDAPPADDDNQEDVFVVALDGTDRVAPVSASPTEEEFPGFEPGFAHASISGDGRYVAFLSGKFGLHNVEKPVRQDVFL